VKTYEGNDIRNVGVVGRGDSGKTTLTAGLLFTAGATNRLLRVDEGLDILRRLQTAPRGALAVRRSFASWKDDGLQLRTDGESPYNGSFSHDV
jgi:hypothetical protein